VSDFVQFPMRDLHLSGFVCDENGERASRATSSSSSLSSSSSSSSPPPIYNLASVVVHRGTMGGGHYVAYCRRGDDWYLFNDESVSHVPAEVVANCEAYVLLYEQQSEDVPLLEATREAAVAAAALRRAAAAAAAAAATAAAAAATAAAAGTEKPPRKGAADGAGPQIGASSMSTCVLPRRELVPRAH
jgi:hypothetical protein